MMNKHSRTNMSSASEHQQQRANQKQAQPCFKQALQGDQNRGSDHQESPSQLNRAQVSHYYSAGHQLTTDQQSSSVGLSGTSSSSSSSISGSSNGSVSGHLGLGASYTDTYAISASNPTNGLGGGDVYAAYAVNHQSSYHVGSLQEGSAGESTTIGGRQLQPTAWQAAATPLESATSPTNVDYSSVDGANQQSQHQHHSYLLYHHQQTTNSWPQSSLCHDGGPASQPSNYGSYYDVHNHSANQFHSHSHSHHQQHQHQSHSHSQHHHQHQQHFHHHAHVHQQQYQQQSYHQVAQDQGYARLQHQHQQQLQHNPYQQDHRYLENDGPVGIGKAPIAQTTSSAAAPYGARLEPIGGSEVLAQPACLQPLQQRYYGGHAESTPSFFQVDCSRDTRAWPSAAESTETGQSGVLDIQHQVAPASSHWSGPRATGGSTQAQTMESSQKPNKPIKQESVSSNEARPVWSGASSSCVVSPAKVGASAGGAATLAPALAATTTTTTTTSTAPTVAVGAPKSATGAGGRQHGSTGVLVNGSSATSLVGRTNQCNVCGRNYARPSTLKTHLRTHTNERPFKCNVCEKTFSQAANLTAHQRVHTGERPFSCPICGRQFSQSSSVITHLRTHSGERPYRCSLCSRTFSDSSTLTKHCRIHSGEKPYRCEFCPLNFSQSGNLSRHLKLHILNGHVLALRAAMAARLAPGTTLASVVRVTSGQLARPDPSASTMAAATNAAAETPPNGDQFCQQAVMSPASVYGATDATSNGGCYGSKKAARTRAESPLVEDGSSRQAAS